MLRAEDMTCTGLNKADPSAVDVPDMPLRALRGRRDRIQVFLSDHLNVEMVVRELGQLKRSRCHSVLRSALDANPSHYADHQWVVAPWRFGDVIYALVHDEYHGWDHRPECKVAKQSEQPRHCWYAAITAVESRDNGRNFAPVPPPLGLVAASPQAFNTGIARAGVHDPTNIVQSPLDHRFYFVATVDADSGTTAGGCVFRSDDPLKAPWLAWDGHDFSVRMAGVGARRCTTVMPISLYNLTWNTVLQQFVGIMQDAHGVGATLSRDLVHWSEPVRIAEAIPAARWQPGMAPATAYFGLVDPASPSPNFDVTGANPYLYFVRFRIADIHPDMLHRDVVRRAVRIR